MKILLISSDNTGHGHKSIAAALTEQFARYEDVQVQVVDGFTWIMGEVGIYMSKTYGPTTRYAKTLHRITYELGNKSVAGVTELAAALIRKKFTDLIRRDPPDLIVTIHPVFNGGVITLLEEMGAHIPVIAHQADLISIHNTWCDPRAYRTICLTPEAREVTIRQGVPAEKVELGYFPTRAAFCEAARNDHRVPYAGQGPFRCLIASGGEGSGNLRKYAKALLKNFDCRVAVLCGRNKRLKTFLEDSLDQYSDRLTAMGFVTNVQDYIMDSDVMITRGSPNTMMEAVVCQTPLIITGALPGQEEENPELFRRHNLAMVCDSSREMVSVMRSLMANGAEKLAEIRAAQRAYRNLDAAKNNVDTIMRLYADYKAGKP